MGAASVLSNVICSALHRLDLCFGGRRTFCKEKYFDLDDVEDEKLDKKLDFDSLLAAARPGVPSS